MAEPTLREVRETLSDLWHEIDNQGGKDSVDGGLFYRAHELMRWLLDEYMARGEMVVDSE